MDRLTNQEQGALLKDKENKTEQEQIYLRLCEFENLREGKALFTKGELNQAITNVVENFAYEIKNKITKEIVSILLLEVKELQEITYEKVEKIGFEIIKEIEGLKKEKK